MKKKQQPLPWDHRARQVILERSAKTRSPHQTTEEALTWDLETVKELRELNGFVHGLRSLEQAVLWMQLNQNEPTVTKQEMVDYATALLRDVQADVATKGNP